MTIKFFSNYDSSANLLKRFLANYFVWDDDLQFTVAENYDFAVVFNRTDEVILSTAKIITVIQEPSWSPAHLNTSYLTGSDYLIIHDAKLFEDKLRIKLGGKVIQSPSYMFFHDRIDKSFFHYEFNTGKAKKISMIVSGMNASVGIYHKRVKLLESILASDLDIDIYGKWLTIDDKRFKGYIDYKFTALLPYEYSIAVENSEEQNYLTEKFVDCVLCNTVPIYHGAPNVDDIYDSKHFRKFDIDSPNVIDDIKKIIAQPAQLPAINKTMYFNKYNLYKKLKEIILE